MLVLGIAFVCGKLVLPDNVLILLKNVNVKVDFDKEVKMVFVNLRKHEHESPAYLAKQVRIDSAVKLVLLPLLELITFSS